MATDAELKAAGFTLPAGTDLIRRGDDAITQNVRATAQWVADKTLPVGTSLTTEDLDSLVTTRFYTQASGPSATLARHYPAEGLACHVAVVAHDARYVAQYAIPLLESVGKQWFYRTRHGDTWQPWRALVTTPLGGRTGQQLVKDGDGAAWVTPPDVYPPAPHGHSEYTSDFAALARRVAILEGVSPEDETVTLPGAFTQQLPFTLTRTATGAYRHDLDLAPYRTGTPIYVNASIGADSNPGSAEQPLRSLTAAFDAAQAAPGDAVIRVRGFFDRRWANVPAAGAHTITGKRVTVIGEGGATLAGADVLLSWTYADGAWSTTRSGTHAIFHADRIDQRGLPIPLPVAASLAECRATADTWWTDGSVVHVNTGSATAAPSPSTHHVLLSSRVMEFELRGDATLVLEDLTILTGSARGFNVAGDSNVQGTLITSNVRVAGGKHSPAANDPNGNVFAVDSLRRSIAVNTVAAYTPQDGFNYHYTLIPEARRRECLVVEVDCEAYRNGLIPGSQNASTTHEGVEAVRIGGHYHDTVGSTVVDVNQGLTALYGVRSSNSETGANIEMQDQAGVWVIDTVAGGAYATSSLAAGAAPTIVSGSSLPVVSGTNITTE